MSGQTRSSRVPTCAEAQRENHKESPESTVSLTLSSKQVSLQLEASIDFLGILNMGLFFTPNNMDNLVTSEIAHWCLPVDARLCYG